MNEIETGYKDTRFRSTMSVIVLNISCSNILNMRQRPADGSRGRRVTERSG